MKKHAQDHDSLLPPIRKQAVGYIRVSTEEQSREGVSMEAQRRKIEAYCDLSDLNLVATEEDAGISGKRLDTRPGLQAALQRLDAGEAGALVVVKLDRLSRSTRDILDLTDNIEKRGWAFHSITEKLDTESAAGRFVLTILAALAQMEREQIGERTRFALAHKKANGERLGTTPFGFETVELDSGGKHLRPIPAEQATLGRIARLRKTGATYRQIAEELNTAQVATKRGGRWHHSTVAYLVRRVIPKAVSPPGF